MPAPERPDDNPRSPERRHFLNQISLLGLAALISAPRRAAANSPAWQNWSGSQTASPANIFYPDSEAALQTLLRQSKGQVRAFGGGHSFSAVVPTNAQGSLISLEALHGLVSHDAKQHTATLRAGSRIASIGPWLQEIGQGLLNEADINTQSLGGAISTATHGTGRGLQCYSATVRGLRLVLADGSLVDCSAESHRELFEAARVAVGSVGIITQATLQNRPAYRLREQVNVMTIDAAMQALERDRDKHRHMEFFAFPLGRKAIVKRMDLSTEAITPPEKPLVDENSILEFAADTARQHAWTTPWLQRLVGAFVSDSVRVGRSWEIFPSPRTVGFNEMEYSLPAERGLECFQEVLAIMQKHEVNVFFPIEFRYVAADDCWLSPFYQRASASISVHQYYRQDYQPFFRLIEPVFRKYQGRPHWGKLHSLGAAELQMLYPRFADFNRVRTTADPQGRMLNAFARKMFVL